MLACATTNQADIARVTASIPAAQWRQLHAALSRLPKVNDGLYKLWVGTQNQYAGGLKKYAMTGLVVVALATPVIAIAVNVANKKTGGTGDVAPTVEAPTRRSARSAKPQAAAPVAPAIPVEPETASSAEATVQPSSVPAPAISAAYYRPQALML